jgi:hypothetical protein
MATLMNQLGLFSLTYVSRARITAGGDSVLQDICTGAATFNEQVGVTGALIYTDQHFGQVIEGSNEALERVMERILNDSRHEHIRVLRRSPIASRLFSLWAMAYVEGGNSLDSVISKGLGSDLNSPDKADVLAKVVQQFARSRLLQQRLRGVANASAPSASPTS